MGYYKNLEVDGQAKADRIVAWYRTHKYTTPGYLVQHLLEDEKRLWGAIEAWERDPFPPKPASEHVALYSPPPLRANRRLAERRKRSNMAIIGYAMVLGAIVVGLIVIGVNV